MAVMAGTEFASGLMSGAKPYLDLMIQRKLAKKDQAEKVGNTIEMLNRLANALSNDPEAAKLFGAFSESMGGVYQNLTGNPYVTLAERKAANDQGDGIGALITTGVKGVESGLSSAASWVGKEVGGLFKSAPAPTKPISTTTLTNGQQTPGQTNLPNRTPIHGPTPLLPNEQQTLGPNNDFSRM